MPSYDNMTVLDFTLGGQCFPGERWNTTFSVVLPAVGLVSPTPAELKACTDQVQATATSTVWGGAGTARSMNTSPVTLDQVSVVARYNDVNQGALTEFYTAVPGSGTGGPLPGTTAVVSTKLTAVSTRRGRGRNYWPVTVASLVETASGQLADASCTSLANAVALFYRDLNLLTWTVGGAGASGICAVTSNPHPGGLPDRTYQAIAEVRVDSRFDRQRGRDRNTASQFVAQVTV